MKPAMLPVLLLLAACNPQSADRATPEEAGGSDTCGAAALADRVGTPVETIEATGPQGRRVIPPGAMVTMDYVAGRLNLVVDASGRLERAYCG